MSARSSFRAALREDRAAFLFCLLLLVVREALHLSFALNTDPREIAFSRTMWLDGQSYLWGAMRLDSNGFGLGNLPDICHCVGQQLLVGALFRLSHQSIPVVREFLIACHFVTGLLVIPLAFKLTGNLRLGYLAAGLTVFSNELGKYCATLQYEPVVACLLVVALLGIADAPLRPGCAIVSGFTCALLCVFRAHFILIAVAIPAALWLASRFAEPARRRATHRALALFGAAFFLLSGAWILALAHNRHQLIFFHEACRVGAYTHMNDIGFTWPYRDVVPPSGMQMVLQHPARYLWLVGRRLAILWGFIPDTWAQPVPLQALADPLGFTAYRMLFLAGFCVLAWLGIARALWDHRRSPELLARFALLTAPMFASMGLMLLMGSATRYLLPGLPMLAIFQAYACFRFFEKPALG